MKKEVEYMIMKAPGSPIDLETTKYYFSFDAHNDTAPANKLKVKDEAMYNQIIGSLSFKLRIFLDSDHLFDNLMDLQYAAYCMAYFTIPYCQYGTIYWFKIR